MNIHPDMQAQAREAIRRRDWGAYLFCSGSHERLARFREIHHLMTDRQYWHFLSEAFIMIESSGPDQAEWIRLLDSPRPWREKLMLAAERRALAALPDPLALYRGYGKGGIRSGLSWSLSESIAREFARRSCDKEGRRAMFGIPVRDEPMIVRGSCRKADVYAYFTRRKEKEIIVRPDRVTGKKSYPA